MSSKKFAPWTWLQGIVRTQSAVPDPSGSGYSTFNEAEDLWPLRRRAIKDSERHLERVRRAIQKRLRKTMVDESIIDAPTGPDRKVKIPVDDIKQYYFKRNIPKDEQKGIWHGGKPLVKAETYGGIGPKDTAIPGGSGGGGGGSGSSLDHIEPTYEAELDLQEIIDAMIESLGLPNLNETKIQEIETSCTRYDTEARKGPMGNLNILRTAKKGMARTIAARVTAQTQAGIINWLGLVWDPRLFELAKLATENPIFSQKIQIDNDDLRFRSYREQKKKHSNAVVYCIMDISASMSEEHRFICKAFYFWVVMFLRKRYTKVDVIFIAHDDEAYFLTEEQFFKADGWGGTIASTGLEAMHENALHTHNPDSWNIYTCYFSDGENYWNDNAKTVAIIKKILEYAQAVFYGEIRILASMSPTGDLVSTPLTEGNDEPHLMYNVFAKEIVPLKKWFVQKRIFSRDDIKEALQAFFSNSQDKNDVNLVDELYKSVQKQLGGQP